MNKKLLLYAGLFPGILYLIGDIVGGIITPDYSYAKNAVSELIRSGAENRILFSSFFLAHAVMIALFAIGIIRRYPYKQSKPIFISGILLLLVGISHSLSGTIFAMDPVGVEMTFPGIMHLVLVGIAIPSIFILMPLMGQGVYRSNNWKSFRLFTFICLAVICISGFSSPIIIAKGIELMGTTERITGYTFYLWLFVLAYLLINKMYSREEILKQCPKPEGEIGRFVGLKMNEHHIPLWEWGLSYISIHQGDIILDAGCGGGESIKVLSGLAQDGKIVGIDHSQDMAALSKETNEDLIERNRVEIYHNSISNLQFSDNMFDVVCAFETYGFWPNIPNDFKEVRRVLKPGGKFIIIHSAYKHALFEERNLYWTELFNITIHDLGELKNILSEAGFISIEPHEKPEENWFTMTARKAEE
ncbi:MAG: DUF998 domain-containing protein [bacterium]|nr:DUF998 domain-containing protein [bacterium]